MDKVVRERFKGLNRALKKQAKEYERRLEALNHEADRIKESQGKSISVEKFEGYVKQVDQRFEALNEDKKKTGRFWLPVIISIVAVLIAAIAMVALFING